MDKADPTSAPALITGIMDKAASEMRATTSKNIDGLVKDLTKQFGESSRLSRRSPGWSARAPRRRSSTPPNRS